MTEKGKKANLLCSWKEIAAYLGCDVRTCYRYKKHFNLPVFYIGSSKNARVCAYKEDLNQWLKTGRNQNKPSGQNKTNHRLLIWGGIAILLMAAVVFRFVLRRDNVPCDFSIRDSVLTIQRHDGKKLWNFDTGSRKLWCQGCQSSHRYGPGF